MIPLSDSRRRWTRDELLLAIHLYYRIPFGRQHSRAPEVVELARCLGRTPGSVAMKLNNLTSIDPSEKERGVRGLQGVSRLDQQIWDEFHANMEALAVESEALWERLVAIESTSTADTGDFQEAQTRTNTQQLSEVKDLSFLSSQMEESFPTRDKWALEPGQAPAGPTDGERTVRVRYAQRFFRRAILAAYNVECCISGNPVPQLLIASHILPWTPYPEQRLNPRNGLCLSRLHDAAFDQYLITLDQDFRLVLSRSLKDFANHETIRVNFCSFEGKRIRMPDKFTPDPAFLAIHRERLSK